MMQLIMPRLCMVLTLLVSSLLMSAAHAIELPQCPAWPEWQRFKQHFISADGRVIDLGSKQDITTSEGQSYAMFFALVANDKNAFDKLLGWTERHLAEGDLSARLPAWLWGRKDNGQYGILDSNPASDSDLWIAYSLAEAGRLWQERRYLVLAAVMAKRIIREETLYQPNLGLTLLPAAKGFEQEGRIKLNPSYATLPIFKRFTSLYPHSPWQALHQASAKMLLDSTQQGVAADWVNHHPERGFSFDSQSKDAGSYNAIRVYLWAGMMAEQAEYKTELMQVLKPMVERISQLGFVPETSYTQSANKALTQGPIGFQAAVLPLLYSTKEHALAKQLYAKVQQTPLSQYEKRYYDNVLMLFAQGWLEQRYLWDESGNVLPAWSYQCR